MADGSSGDDDYRRVRSKRQRLKEKKKRQKAKKAEAALRPSPLLAAEVERERLWILDSLKPTPEAVDQALAGHPAAPPLLLRLLMSADSLSSSLAQVGLDPTYSCPVLRRLFLSHSPLTLEALTSAVEIHISTL